MSVFKDYQGRFRFRLTVSMCGLAVPQLSESSLFGCRETVLGMLAALFPVFREGSSLCLPRGTTDLEVQG